MGEDAQQGLREILARRVLQSLRSTAGFCLFCREHPSGYGAD